MQNIKTFFSNTIHSLILNNKLPSTFRKFTYKHLYLNIHSYLISKHQIKSNPSNYPKYISPTCGDIQNSLLNCIKSTFLDLKHYKILNLYIPYTIYNTKTLISESLPFFEYIDYIQSIN